MQEREPEKSTEKGQLEAGLSTVDSAWRKESAGRWTPSANLSCFGNELGPLRGTEGARDMNRCQHEHERNEEKPERLRPKFLFTAHGPRSEAD